MLTFKEARVQLEPHRKMGDSECFHIEFDSYYTTHSPENQALVEQIYARLKERGLVTWRPIRQAYDEQAQMFLPCATCRS